EFRSGSIPFFYIDETKPKQIRFHPFLPKNRGWVATSGFLPIITTFKSKVDYTFFERVRLLASRHSDCRRMTIILMIPHS
ncbi:hypothetical protein, partial [Streptococcus sp. GMD5S]|uniref:hypothetical protein n=1 Tax=Streptococcus sp. GMD5S TaxID=1169674 RepID=UPI001ED9A4AF